MRGERDFTVGSVLTVTAVSVLIWLWAANETIASERTTFKIRFESPDPAAIMVRPTATFDVSADLHGSKSRLSTAKGFLAQVLVLRPGAAGVPPEPGVHTITLADAVQRHPDFGDLGVTIDNILPDQRSLEIDALASETVGIVPTIRGVDIEGVPKIDPGQVMLSLASTTRKRLGVPRVEAVLRPEAVDRLETGREQTVACEFRVVDATAAESADIRITPPTGQATFMLRSRTSAVKIPSVPVQIAGPPDDLVKYDIVLNPDDVFLREVTVSGEADAIRPIADHKVTPIAFVHLNANDLARGIESKAISMWQLPPGVVVVDPGFTGTTSPTETGPRIAPVIHFKITRR